MDDMAAKHLRSVALAIGAAWACWWVFFELAESLADRRFGQAAFFLIAMFAAVVLAWKWPAAGSVLFLVEGFASIAMFAPSWAHRFRFYEFLVMFAMMPLPPIAAGILLLLSRRHPNTREPAVL